MSFESSSDSPLALLKRLPLASPRATTAERIRRRAAATLVAHQAALPHARASHPPRAGWLDVALYAGCSIYLIIALGNGLALALQLP